MAITSLAPATNAQQFQVRSTQLRYQTPFGGRFANAETAWTTASATFTAGSLSMRVNGVGGGAGFDAIYPPASAAYLHRVAELPASNPTESFFVFPRMPSAQLWSMSFALSLAGGSAASKTAVARLWAMSPVETSSTTIERIGTYIGELSLTAGSLPVTLSEAGAKSGLYPGSITGDYYWCDTIGITEDLSLSRNMRVVGNKAGCVASLVFDALGNTDLVVAMGKGAANAADAGFVLPRGV